MATKKKKTSSSSNDGTIGIDISGIAKMQSAITNYKNAMKRDIKIDATSSQINQAIKGKNTQNTLIQLTNQIQSKIKSYLKGLDQFSTQLGQLNSQYSKADKNNEVFSSAVKEVKNK